VKLIFSTNEKLFTVTFLRSHVMIWYMYQLQLNNTTSVPASHISDMTALHGGWCDTDPCH